MADHYSIITKKFTLRTSHTGWLHATRELYNEVLSFYYHLFLQHPELCDMNGQQILRALEQMTIVGRDKKPVPKPLPWEKVPLYFRRAAINEAIAAGKSYLVRDRQTTPTEEFSSGITLYKGMYKDLEAENVSIKVYDGMKWRWIHCRLSGNKLPEGAECLSPKVVFKGKYLQLHIPVKEGVSDGRTLKKRVDESLKICSLQFTNDDAVAVCCVMDMENTVHSVKFIRGGRNYRMRCQKLLGYIERSRQATGGQAVEGANKRYWNRLRSISEDVTHKVSREIVNFCKVNNVSVIVLPKYSKNFTHMVMAASGKWSPIQLSYRVIDKLYYKAWKFGILVIETEASDISRFCAVCGGSLRKDGVMFSCEQGHKGDRRVNAARNLGKKCISNIKKQML